MATTGILLKFGLIFAAVSLSSCRAVVDTKINKDGSGELRTSMAFSAEEKQNFDNAPNNTDKNICDNLRNDAPPNTVFIEEARGDEIYCTTLHSFSTLKQLRSFYDGMLNVTVNELRMGLGVFVFNVQVDLTPRNGNEATAHEWRLTLPGEIGSNNADVSEGSTLIWTLEPGEIRTLQAESAVGLNALTQVLVGGLIVLLGIMFAVWIARKIAKQNEQYSVNNLSAHSMSCTRIEGLAKVAFFPSRSDSRTPRACEHAPQMCRGIPSASVFCRVSASGGHPTGITAFATGSRIKDTASPSKKI